MGSKVLQHTKMVTKYKIWYIEAEKRLQSEKSLLFLFKRGIVILTVWDYNMLKKLTERTKILILFFKL